MRTRSIRVHELEGSIPPKPLFDGQGAEKRGDMSNAYEKIQLKLREEMTDLEKLIADFGGHSPADRKRRESSAGELAALEARVTELEGLLRVYGEFHQNVAETVEMNESHWKHHLHADLEILRLGLEALSHEQTGNGSGGTDE
jgi:hypothetical protein